MFWNDFLPSRFFISEISFAYGTTILKTPKTVKGSFDIFEECRVQEEKCRVAGRSCLIFSFLISLDKI